MERIEAQIAQLRMIADRDVATFMHQQLVEIKT
jgi:hypothetical protein